MIRAMQRITDPLRQFLRWQEPVRFDHAPQGMEPRRFNRIEPGTRDGQRADTQPRPLPAGLDLPVVCPHPGTHCLAGMPGGSALDQHQHQHQHQHTRAARRRCLTAPVEEAGRQRADGTTVQEAQPDLRGGGKEHPVAGQRLRVGSLRATTCSISRRGCSSGAQACRGGAASRLHQSSSC